MTRKTYQFLAGAAAATLFVSSVHGVPISVTNASPAEAAYGSAGVGQSVGTDGYYLFATGYTNGTYTDTSNLPSYATAPTETGDTDFGGSYKGGTLYATLTVHPTSSVSTSLVTGVVYRSNAGSTLATFTLTGVVPAEFQLGLLSNNTNSTTNYTDYLVTDSNSLTSASNATVSNPSGTSYVAGDGDYFYLVDITGATAGDTITIFGTAETASNNALGGITFDTIIPAPEPATLGLMAVAAIGLLTRRRRASERV